MFLGVRVDGGDLLFSWRRRSRSGFAWLDGVDAPLGEAREAYRVGVTVAGAPPRAATTEQPEWRYSAAAQAADGANPGKLVTLDVAQSSDVAGPGAAASSVFILP